MGYGDAGYLTVPVLDRQRCQPLYHPGLSLEVDSLAMMKWIGYRMR